jgi:N-acetylmuramoyl-L-alanine amidase/Putative peptidoglycan binding domain
MSPRVLIQAGHEKPLEPGITGLGANGEVQLTKAIRDALVKLLGHDDRFEAISSPGNLPDGIRVDAALFLHCDGVENAPSAGGFSFGFPTDKGPKHKALAGQIREEFMKLPVGHPNGNRADNGTSDASQYYGFRHDRVITGSMCLVEHGFVSNPTEHAWLKAHVGDLAAAEYRALCRHFGLTPHDGSRTPTLFKGMSPNREAVTRLQKLLRGANVADTPLNGKYDEATRVAVKRFQRKHDIPTDDQATVGPKTWKALEEVNA